MYGLTAVVAGIDDAAIAIAGETLLFCNPAGSEQLLAHDRLILGLQVCHTGDVFFGNQQDVVRGAGIDVPKRIQMLIAVQAVRRNLSCHYPAEQAVTHGASSWVAKRCTLLQVDSVTAWAAGPNFLCHRVSSPRLARRPRCQKPVQEIIKYGNQCLETTDPE